MSWLGDIGGLFQGPESRQEYNLRNGNLEHKDQLNGLINQGLAGLQGRTAPQLDASPQNQFRSGQMQQIGNLQGIANGTQMGAGELAAQRGAQNSLAAQQALAHMRGAGGMGMRVAARNAAGIGINAAGMGQQAAMQDQQGANALLSQALGQGRGQDLSLAGSNAQLQQQQMGLNDAQYNALLHQLYGMDATQLQTQLGIRQQDTATNGALLSGAGQVIGAGLMASDERLKTDIAPAGDEIDGMLDALKPYRYRYKDKKFGEGDRAGIMAQDLELSEAGRRVVTDTAEGKMLDVNKALSAALASAARLNERVRKLEARG